MDQGPCLALRRSATLGLISSRGVRRILGPPSRVTNSGRLPMTDPARPSSVISTSRPDAFDLKPPIRARLTKAVKRATRAKPRIFQPRPPRLQACQPRTMVTPSCPCGTGNVISGGPRQRECPPGARKMRRAVPRIPRSGHPPVFARRATINGYNPVYLASQEQRKLITGPCATS